MAGAPVKFTEPGGFAREHPEAQVGQALFRERAHHEQIVVEPETVHEAPLTEGVIGLVHHHQPRRAANHFLDGRGIETNCRSDCSARQIHHGRLMALDGLGIAGVSSAKPVPSGTPTNFTPAKVAIMSYITNVGTGASTMALDVRGSSERSE